MSIFIRTALVSECDLLEEIDVDASVLFEQAGFGSVFPSDHEFSIVERKRWLASLSAGTALIASDSCGAPVGFVAVGQVDGEPYVDQISVRAASMRHGIGTQLLTAASSVARQVGGRALWLTTYSHLAWNRPYYERRGFVVVAEDSCGPQIRQVLSFERRWLPFPEERIVMRREIDDERPRN